MYRTFFLVRPTAGGKPASVEERITVQDVGEQLMVELVTARLDGGEATTDQLKREFPEAMAAMPRYLDTQVKARWPSPLRGPFRLRTESGDPTDHELLTWFAEHAGGEA